MQMKNYLLAPMLAMMLAACGGKNTANNAASAPAASSGKEIKVALDPLYPPFVQQTPQGLEGFDVDILKAAAQKAGFEVHFAPYPWDGLFERLNTNEVDIIAGGITVSEERKPNMDFSNTYNDIETVLLVTKDSPIQNFEQARDKKVAYQLGTSAETQLKKLQNTNELDKSLGSNSAWETTKRLLATNNTKVDAVIGDDAPLLYYAKQYPDAGLHTIHNEKLPKESNAFAVKKGNAELLAKLNKGLADIKADGTYAKIREKWLGK